MGILLFKRILQMPQQRYVHTVMSFFALLSLSTTSGILSLTITQMVRPIVAPLNASAAVAMSKFAEPSCPLPDAAVDHNDSSADHHALFDERYDWSEGLQGLILGSYYIGFVIMHIPGALLTERTGGKIVLVIGLACTATCTLLTPLVVTMGGAYGLMAIRILVGCLQGGMWAAVSTVLASWVPKRERGTLVSLAFCGLACGGVVGNLVAGFLLHTFKTWHVVFYAFGALGWTVSLLYCFLCSNNPATHAFITDKEKAYLQKEIGQLQREKMPTPWRAILTSRPVIVSVIDMCFCNWAYFVIMIDLPKYMNDVLHVSVRENGFYSSAPWAVRIMVTFISGRWADWLIRSGRLSVTNTRKLFILITATIDGSFLMAAAYAGCDARLVGLFIIMSVGAQGMIPSSTLVVPMDLSPNFAGAISALTNGVASTTGFLVPFVIGLLTPNSLQSEWRVVFWMTCCFHCLKVANFLLFGSANVQPWNSPNPKVAETDAAASQEKGVDHKQVAVISVELPRE